MKKFAFILFLTVFTGKIYSQDNPCNMEWGQTFRTISTNEGAVYYAVQYSRCTSSGVCGYPKVALEHTFPFPVSITVKLRGKDCDSKTIEAEFSTSAKEIPANQRYIEQGNWHYFKQVAEYIKVEVNYKKGNDRYTILYDKYKGINETTINGMSIADFNAKKQKEKEAQTTAKTTTTQTPTYSTSTNNNYSQKTQQPTNTHSSNNNYNQQQIQDAQNRINQTQSSYQAKSTAVNNAFDQLSNSLTEMREKRQAQEAAAEERRAKREEEQRQRDEIRRREEAERQARYAEEQRQREIAERVERERQWNVDLKIIGNNGIQKNTSDLNAVVKKAYFIIYERSYSTGKVNVKTYSLDKYSDDTWMMKSDFLKKIGFEPYFNNSGSGILLGAYDNKQTAMQVLNQIRSTTQNAVINTDFLSLTNTKPAKTDADFWNN